MLRFKALAFLQDNLAETQKNFEFIKGYYSETEKNSEFTKDFVLVDLCKIEKKIIFCENIFILKIKCVII